MEKNPYDSAFIKESFESNLELCEHNIHLLNDFYIANEENRRQIIKVLSK